MDLFGTCYFDGIINGLHCGVLIVDSEILLDFFFNYIGDILWDCCEGGWLLLLFECYLLQFGNTCGCGMIGVVDLCMLRWRYGVELVQDEIAKAMWCEVLFDGWFVWMLFGVDLFVYWVDVICCGVGLLCLVKWLLGAALSSGVIGAVFYGEWLLLVSQLGGSFQIWFVDLRTGVHWVEIKRVYSGEFEGFNMNLDGTFDWILMLVDLFWCLLTFKQNVLLHFWLVCCWLALWLRVTREGGVLCLCVFGLDGLVVGVVVRVGWWYVLTGVDGVVRICVCYVTVMRADFWVASL